MSSSKPGLADLKRLRASAEAAQKAELASARAQAQRTAAQKPSEPLTAEAVALFARATQLVQPLQTRTGRVLHKPNSKVSDADQLAQKRNRAIGVSTAPAFYHSAPQPKAGATGASAQISDAYTPISDTNEDIAWHAAGIGPDTLRKLKQAWWPVGSQIDLHGLTRDEARQALMNFIETSQHHATRCVRIIHGQGYGSPSGQAVLRSQVAQWLTQIDAITAFATAPKAQGGRGALLALVRLS